MRLLCSDYLESHSLESFVIVDSVCFDTSGQGRAYPRIRFVFIQHALAALKMLIIS